MQAIIDRALKTVSFHADGRRVTLDADQLNDYIEMLRDARNDLGIVPDGPAVTPAEIVYDANGDNGLIVQSTRPGGELMLQAFASHAPFDRIVIILDGRQEATLRNVLRERQKSRGR
jgi:hypothetical protein